MFNKWFFFILVSPRITKRPIDRKINEGENINITCDAEGPPKPTFTWSFDRERVTIEKIIEKNNLLVLQNVRSTGVYKFVVTCQAANKAGNRTASATVNILGMFILHLMSNRNL